MRRVLASARADARPLRTCPAARLAHAARYTEPCDDSPQGQQRGWCGKRSHDGPVWRPACAPLTPSRRARRAQAGLARHSSGAEWVAGEAPSSPMGPRMNLHVGVLHYTPFREPFPLLAEPVTYTPDTLDIWARA